MKKLLLQAEFKWITLTDTLAYKIAVKFTDKKLQLEQHNWLTLTNTQAYNIAVKFTGKKVTTGIT